MKLTISIISTNEADELERCLKCIYAEIGISDFEVYVVDNACTDGTSDMLKKNYPQVKIIANSIKKGFSENHNMVIAASEGEHVLILNPDVYLTPSYLQGLLKAMDSDQKIGIAMGKLLRTKNSHAGETIDSTGIDVFRNRRSIDRGQGERDVGQFDTDGEIFGASGAAMLCRRKMLEDIRLNGDYFDKDFYAYKEDLDLAWRARLRGWKVYYVAKSIAYHDRRWGIETKRNMIKRSTRRESFKNRYLMLIKDEFLGSYLRDLPAILLNELKVLVYITFIEPHLWLAVINTIRQVPRSVSKRRMIMSRALVPASEIRRWFK